MALTLHTHPTQRTPQHASTAPISDQISETASAWAQSQHLLITLAVELADSSEWIAAGSPTPAHHIAAIADIEPCTASEWLRVGTRISELPVTADAFANALLSYSKVRALVAIATPDNETELTALAIQTPAGELRMELARWLNNNVEQQR